MKVWGLLLAAAALVACGDDGTTHNTTNGSSSSSGTTSASTTDTSSSSGTQGTDGTSSSSGTQGTTIGTSTGETGGTSTGTGSTGTGGSDINCNPSTVACDGPIPECPPGEVPAVEGACWGACVPILSCATQANCDNCQDGICTEYVAFAVEYRCVMPTLMCSALACSCLAPYVCTDPFDACSDNPMDGAVSCACPTCDG